ncbi:hypothetical protein M0805_000424 [Coniferiporia weirii]|nr:hypothetical protein M0805_000424 [Coniferiporia weirii]
MSDACGLSLDTANAGSGTWHASVSPGSMSLTFNGTAVYAYFIVPSFLFLDKMYDPLQVGSYVSFILDGVQVQIFERVNALGMVEYNVPAYVNASLSAGLHNLTIQNNVAAGSVSPAAVFDYAVYSSEGSEAPERDINVGALVAGLLGGILFVGLGLTAFAFLRIRARRYANAARIDALEAQLPVIIFNKEASSSHASPYPERHVDKAKQTAMNPRKFVDTQPSLDAPFPPNFRYSICLPGTGGQRGNVSRLEANGMHISKSPQSGVDVILLRNSLASQGTGMARRRSTLSRLGIRLGGDNSEGRLRALQSAEHSAVDATGITIRRRTVSRADAGGGEDSEPSTISRDDTVLLLRLQAEIELLRAERERTRRLYSVEDLPAYSEHDTSDGSSGVQ